MRIEFDDEEYPELARYLENPKRKMKFLYFLEELFTDNSFDPVVDGLKPQNKNNSDNVDSNQTLTPYLDGIAQLLEKLTGIMDGAVIGRFPVEHVIHQVVPVVDQSNNKKEEEEEDFSDMSGIDFSQSIAAFED